MWIVNYQVVTLIAAIIPDEISLLKEINKSLDIWPAITILSNTIFSQLILRTIQKTALIWP